MYVEERSKCRFSNRAFIHVSFVRKIIIINCMGLKYAALCQSKYILKTAVNSFYFGKHNLSVTSHIHLF